jgi:hypothetical protein
MKILFLLCAVIGVALTLGCANQNSPATTSAPRLDPQSGVVGSGSGGGGGGSFPGRGNMGKQQP